VDEPHEGVETDEEAPDDAAGTADRAGDAAGAADPDEEPDDGPDEEPDLPPAVDLPAPFRIPFLRDGDLEIVGRLVQASNTTLLVTITGDVPGAG